MRELTRAMLGGLLVAFLVAAPAALAESALHQARAAGHLGERPDGYVGVVPGAPASATALADDVNTKRRVEYTRLATEHGTSAAAVAALAGEKLVAEAPPGQWVMNPDGTWRQK
jgi:uncharacterized protein YdbL (DUF1318 family)